MQLSQGLSHHHTTGGWSPSPAPSQALAAGAASRRSCGGGGGGAVAATHAQAGAGAPPVQQPAAAAAALGARLAPLAPHEVWYLAFGSNMSPQVLTGRRRVRPRESLPCWVPGYTLSFNVTGFPFAEPGFATVAHCERCRDRRSALHGVLHRVTQQEWASIQASEGVLPGDSHGASIGYQVISVDCTLYFDDATVVKALTLQAAPASMHAAERKVLPSARYLRLLQEGSKHHGLDAHYQQQLQRLQPYQPVSSFQQAVGGLASGAVLASAASTALPAYVLSRALQQRVQEDEADLLTFMRRHTNASQCVMWHLHDAVLAPLLGSGCSNDNSQG